MTHRQSTEHDRGDFIHLHDMSLEMTQDVLTSIIAIFEERDLCPRCGAALLRQFADMVQDSWAAVAADAPPCKH